MKQEEDIDTEKEDQRYLLLGLKKGEASNIGSESMISPSGLASPNTDSSRFFGNERKSNRIR